MTIINISSGDLTEQNTGSYEALPKGTYSTTIFSAELTEVKSGDNAGKPQLKVQLKVADGEEYANRRLFTYVPLYTGKAFWKTQAFFTALGYDMKAGNFQVPEINELLGKSIGAKVTVVPNSMSGEDENNVGGFTSATSGNVDAVLKSMGATPASTGGIW